MYRVLGGVDGRTRLVLVRWRESDGRKRQLHRCRRTGDGSFLEGWHVVARVLVEDRVELRGALEAGLEWLLGDRVWCGED